MGLSPGPYDFGGILTNTNRDVVNGETVQKRNQAQKEMHWWEIQLVVVQMFKHLQTKTIFTTWNLMKQSCWHACLLCCSLHPGDLFPFTRKPLFIIVDSSNSTAYKVWSNQELEHKSNSLAVDYFHMLIMTHQYQVPSQLSHMMDACQIRWKTDETMIKPMMCAHVHMYMYHVCHTPVIPLWYACDAGLWQTRWYVLWGCWTLLSLSTSVWLCCLTEFYQSFRPTSCVSAVSHHLSQGHSR